MGAVGASVPTQFETLDLRTHDLWKLKALYGVYNKKLHTWREERV